MSNPTTAELGFMSQMGNNALSMFQNYQNIKFQREQNTLDRQHELDMYLRQRQNAQDDWNTQNAYNSPLQQMQRLREAGLNPNLVYGKGADNTAGMIRAASNQPSSKPAPRLDLSNMGFDFVDLKMKSAQTDNLYQQNAVLKAEQALKQAQTLNELTKEKKTSFDLTYAMEAKESMLRNLTLQNDAVLAGIERTKTQTFIDWQENDRKALANTANVAKTWQDIAYSKQQVIESKQRVLHTKASTSLLDSKYTTEAMQQSKMAEEIRQLKLIQDITKDKAKVAALEAYLSEQGIFRDTPSYMRAFMTLADAWYGSAMGGGKPIFRPQ